MKGKLVEIRDDGTFIPAMAVEVSGEDGYLMRRAGFQSPLVILIKLVGGGKPGQWSYDPYAWGGRTMPVAHQWIQEHWEELKDGQVVDVEYILGERTEPKISEAVTVPG